MASGILLRFAGFSETITLECELGILNFKANRELVKDLMTPNFLNTVSAPAIYSNTLRLVELWKLKAKKAGGLPFQADKDINMATFDIIKEVALGEGDSENTTEAYIKIIHQPGAQT
ncbi:hypothetical protein GCG54_00010877 [Colletotrichum gloeosporioides]|uniref:Uncharacterized protein n=1 Tax=Colletotrichum gloeosporioides TaxID=474922 RepID=A0A8H4CRF0_COLGL|nr:uncharacterized protein GCG54_00010877 [Colletotrichum gloeosporioides]KAF3808688.1 hypothetical protein GCG54_00010877 [Colletotrichum gloeosporioides]